MARRVTVEIEDFTTKKAVFELSAIGPADGLYTKTLEAVFGPASRNTNDSDTGTTFFWINSAFKMIDHVPTRRSG